MYVGVHDARRYDLSVSVDNRDSRRRLNVADGYDLAPFYQDGSLLDRAMSRGQDPAILDENVSVSLELGLSITVGLDRKLLRKCDVCGEKDREQR